MAWICLFLSGLLEIVWAWYMKQSDGLTRLWPTVMTFVTMGIGIALLSYSLKTLPLGTTYGIWTGIGVIGTFVVGILFLGEPATLLRIGSAALILTGIVGLKLSTTN